MRAIDLIFGGVPCQALSSIGQRRPDDERNQLFFAFADLVRRVRPKYFVIENVPGLVTRRSRGLLQRLLRRLQRLRAGEAHYRVLDPWILDAADFGVPQHRVRVFLVGVRACEGDDLVVPMPPIPTVCPADRDPGGLLVMGPSVADALEGLPDIDDARLAALAESDEVALPAALRVVPTNPYARLLRALDVDPLDFSYPRRFDPTILTSSWRTSHSPESRERFAATAAGETEAISRFYRLSAAGLSNTLRAGTGRERGAFTAPRPIHPILPRVVTVREAARLHSFPDWARFHATKAHGFRELGNSVPPLLARAVARQIMLALGASPPKPTRVLETGNPRLLSMTMTEACAALGADAARIPPQRRQRRRNSVRCHA